MTTREKKRKTTSAARSAQRSKPDGTKETEGKQTRGDRSKRLLDLVMLLLGARSPVTFRDIREQFTAYQTRNAEAGLRAFERDKADLLELGVPIRYITPDEDDAVEEGGYLVDLKRFRLPEVHLTPDEISALVLAASVARAVPGVSYARIVDLALRKLAFDVPEPPDTPVEFPPPPGEVARREPLLVHFPSVPPQKARQIGDRFAQLEAATRNRKRVTLRYRDGSSGYVSNRDVDPYGLIYREGSWLLAGHCHLRKDVRTFRLDRILDLKIAPKPKSPDFERPTDFDARAYANRSPWTFHGHEPGAEEVELEIRPEAASVANEDFGADAEKTRQEGGGFLVRFRCGNPTYAVSRVLAAKGGIRVRRGEALRDHLQSELAAVEAMYDGGTR